MTLLLGVIGALPGKVEAATLTVNSTSDAVDATPGDGFCDDGAGNCTLPHCPPLPTRWSLTATPSPGPVPTPTARASGPMQC